MKIRYFVLLALMSKTAIPISEGLKMQENKALKETIRNRSDQEKNTALEKRLDNHYSWTARITGTRARYKTKFNNLKESPEIQNLILDLNDKDLSDLSTKLKNMNHETIEKNLNGIKTLLEKEKKDSNKSTHLIQDLEKLQEKLEKQKNIQKQITPTEKQASLKINRQQTIENKEYLKKAEEEKKQKETRIKIIEKKQDKTGNLSFESKPVKKTSKDINSEKIVNEYIDNALVEGESTKFFSDATEKDLENKMKDEKTKIGAKYNLLQYLKQIDDYLEDVLLPNLKKEKETLEKQPKNKNKLKEVEDKIVKSSQLSGWLREKAAKIQGITDANIDEKITIPVVPDYLEYEGAGDW